MVENAAVASGGDVVIQLQFEPAIFIAGHNIARLLRIGANQAPILDHPAGPELSAVPAMPAVEIGAVKEKPPARRLFLRGEGVEVGVGGRRRLPAERQREQGGRPGREKTE